MNEALGRQTRLNLICAGSSGVMLCFAHVHPEFWYFSFFALAPLLWRLCHVSRTQALILGLIVATTYVFATHFGRLLTTPGDFVLRLVTMNLAFAGFAFVFRSLRSRLRFNPLVIAAMWFPAGGLMIHYAGLAEVLGPMVAPELVAGLGSLGGLVLCSSVIVLGNLIILLLARYVKRRLLCRSHVRTDRFRRLVILSDILPITVRWALIPSRRAPPLV